MLNIQKFKDAYKDKIIETEKGLSVKIEIDKIDIAAGQWDYYEIKAINNENNQDIGTLTVALMEDDKFDKYFGNILKFAQFKGHRNLNVSPDPFREKIENRKRNENKKDNEIFEAANNIIKRKSLFDDNQLNDPETQEGKKNILKTQVRTDDEKEEINNLNNKEIDKKFDLFIENLKQKMGEQYQKFIEYHYKKPEPHFVQVENDFRRQGVAKVLYQVANEIVSDKNYRLYQSTTQTAEAENFWKKQMASSNTENDDVSNRAYLKPNKKIRQRPKLN